MSPWVRWCQLLYSELHSRLFQLSFPAGLSFLAHKKPALKKHSYLDKGGRAGGRICRTLDFMAVLIYSAFPNRMP